MSKKGQHPFGDQKDSLVKQSKKNILDKSFYVFPTSKGFDVLNHDQDRPKLSADLSHASAFDLADCAVANSETCPPDLLHTLASQIFLITETLQKMNSKLELAINKPCSCTTHQVKRRSIGTNMKQPTEMEECMAQEDHSEKFRGPAGRQTNASFKLAKNSDLARKSCFTSNLRSNHDFPSLVDLIISSPCEKHHSCHNLPVTRPDELNGSDAYYDIADSNLLCSFSRLPSSDQLYILTRFEALYSNLKSIASVKCDTTEEDAPASNLTPASENPFLPYILLQNNATDPQDGDTNAQEDPDAAILIEAEDFPPPRCVAMSKPEIRKNRVLEVKFVADEEVPQHIFEDQVLEVKFVADEEVLQHISENVEAPRPEDAPEEVALLMEHLDQTPVKASRMQFILHGWPTQNPDEATHPCWNRRTELSVVNRCVLWGTRVVIPPQGKQEALQELHQAHAGISRMKALAHSDIWWPHLDEDLERECKQCAQCISEADGACTMTSLSRSPRREDSEDPEFPTPRKNDAAEEHHYPRRARRTPVYLKDYIRATEFFVLSPAATEWIENLDISI